MVPTMDIQFDPVLLQRAIDGLGATGDSCGLTVQWLVWDCARIAANNCIKYSAPWAGSGKPGNTKKQRDTGAAAVTTDLVGRKGQTEASRSGLFGFYTESMSIYETFNGGKDLPNFNLIRLKSGAVYLVDKNVSMQGAGPADLSRVHLANRGANGRVSTAGRKDRKIGRWKAKNKYFAPRASVLSYLASVQKRVGTLKAGWLAAARYFASKTGGKVSSATWIDRHGDLGSSSDSMRADGNGEAAMINNVPHASALRPSFKPFIERTANKYIETYLPKRMDQVCARFQAGQAKREAVNS